MKKFIAITIALSIVSLIIGTSFFVYADDEETSSMTIQEYYAAQSWLIAKYCDGTYTYDEYFTQSDSVTNRFIEENSIGTVSDAVMTQYDYAVNRTRAIGEKIGAIVEKYGDAAVSYIKNWISDFLDDYSCLSDVNTSGVDMKGYGAVAYMVSVSNAKNYSIIYCDYIVVSSESNYPYIDFNCRCNSDDGLCCLYRHYSSGSENETYSNAFGISGNYNLESYSFYGDVRYDDGTAYETDDTYETVEDYDFTQANEQELADLLNKILEALENNNPDLSSIEGLLQAIYYRLGTLDSDNDNAKLDMINASILSLCSAINSNSDDSTDDSNSDDSTDDSNSEDTASDGYAEVLDILIEMRDYLKEGMDGLNGSEADEHEIAGTLYNVKPLDKSWLNNLTTDKTELKVEYEGKTYYLESDGCLKLDGKYYHVDLNYDSYTDIDYDFNNDNVSIDESKYVDVDFNNYDKMWANLSDTQKDKLNDITELISKLVAQGIPYSAVTGGLTFYQDIIFNSHDPKDIVLNLDFEGQSYSFTILSTSFFSGKGAQAIQIMKNFISIVTIYVWLLSMRRKTSSMMR